MNCMFIMCEKDNKTYLQIEKILEKYSFSIIDSLNTFICQHGRLIIRIDYNASLKANNEYILFLESDNNQRPTLFGKLNGICNSSNEKALNILKANNISTILIGMSKTDTITFSSISDQKALISVQRPIKIINGKTLEPCEISVKLSHKYSNSAVICACTILILNDIEIIEL